MTQDWQDLAACEGMDREIFFPVSETGPGMRDVLRAKATCAGCPVRQECLDFAMDRGLDYGIYGGLTPDERRKLRLRDHVRA